MSLISNKNFWVAIIVTFICSIVGKGLATLPGFSLIGHLVIALLLGMMVQFMKSVTAVSREGTGFIANKFLRAGIIFMGFKLNLVILLSNGVKSLAAAVILVTGMIALTYGVSRLMKVDHTVAMLTSCGCSICGAAAVMGVAPSLKAKADQSVLAVAIVAIMGTVFTLIEVTLQPYLGLLDTQFGVMAGLSLHEIAHAVAAAGVVSQEGMDSAIIAKLSRVLLLAPVALIFGLIEYRRNRNESEGLHIPIPYFMGGFIIASAIGSYASLPVDMVSGLVNLAYMLLGMAMAALGINVNFHVIVKSGARPMLAAFICSICLMLVVYEVVLHFF